MNEIIKINDQNYTVRNVNTGLDTISFVIDDSAAGDVEALFRSTKALEVGNEAGEMYGNYPNVEFESLTIHADESISITMRILSKMEMQISALQISQDEQDAAIAAMMFGGEGNE